MSLYSYKAKNDKGQTLSGQLDVENEFELARALHQQKLFLLSAQKEGVKKAGGFSMGSIFGRVSLVEKMMFTQHLAVMVEAGLGFSQALKALSVQVKSSRFKKILSRIEDDVRQGKSFSDSLDKYPKVFGPLYVNMIRVGETGGNLEQILRNLAEQMKKDHELVSRVRGAMVYPGVILVAMLGIGILMMIMVVPQLNQVFKDLEIELPFTTRIVMGLSEFLTNNIILFLASLIVFIFLFRIFANTGVGKKIFHKIFLAVPIFGPIVQKVNSARFARTFSSLIDSGVSIVKTLEITAGTLSNVYYKQALLESAKQVQKGQPLSQALVAYGKLYPPMVIQMLSVGEETGALSDILKNLANFYEGEIENITKNMSSIIEPVLMIIIGAAVGFFAVSMIQPMYSMVQSL